MIFDGEQFFLLCKYLFVIVCGETIIKKIESVKSSIIKIKIYDRLRSVSELKLSSTPQISIH